MQTRVVWRRVAAAAAVAADSVPRRGYSEARTSLSGAAASAWGGDTVNKTSASPSYPRALADFPLPQPRMRKTHIEWKLHHGHGVRYGQYGPSREVADYEYADGTPAPVSSRRFAYKHHQDHLLVQLIQAGALVERYEAEGMLPRVPGVPEQRDWDPAIPLFLDDLDEYGQPPALDTAGASAHAATATTAAHGAGGGGPQTHLRIRSAVAARVTDEHFARTQAKPPAHIANASAGETLQPSTMFASYDPAAFVDDTVRMRDARRPHWSRLRWSLNDSFLVPKEMQAKNTIKDD